MRDVLRNILFSSIPRFSVSPRKFAHFGQHFCAKNYLEVNNFILTFICYKHDTKRYTSLKNFSTFATEFIEEIHGLFISISYERSSYTGKVKYMSYTYSSQYLIALFHTGSQYCLYCFILEC